MTTKGKLILLIVILVLMIAVYLERRYDNAEVSFQAPEQIQEGELKGIYSTDSGMHGIWEPNCFSRINSFKSWEREFVKDESIQKNIKNGCFVPIYVHSDGSPAINIRAGNDNRIAVINDQERSWIYKESDYYLFNSKGMALVSGIEYISASPNKDVGRLKLEEQPYEVKIYYLRWPKNLYDEHDIYPPDFLVIMNLKSGTIREYRGKVETFDTEP